MILHLHNVYADLDAREYVFLLEVFDTGISYDYNYRFHWSALCEHTFISLALHWSQIRNILCFCCLWVSGGFSTNVKCEWHVLRRRASACVESTLPRV